MINSDFGKRRVVIYARVSTDHKEQLSALENQLDWYLRFDGDPNDPLHLKTEGRRRQNSSVSTVGGHLPTTPFGDAGSYQRLIVDI